MDFSTVNPTVIIMIMTMLGNLVATIWWAASVSNKVSSLESRVESMEAEQLSFDTQQMERWGMISRLDERTAAMMLGIERLERRISSMSTSGGGK